MVTGVASGVMPRQRSLRRGRGQMDSDGASSGVRLLGATTRANRPDERQYRRRTRPTPKSRQSRGRLRWPNRQAPSSRTARVPATLRRDRRSGTDARLRSAGRGTRAHSAVLPEVPLEDRGEEAQESGGFVPILLRKIPLHPPASAVRRTAQLQSVAVRSVVINPGRKALDPSGPDIRFERVKRAA